MAVKGGESEGGLLVSCARATRGLRRPSLHARSGRPNSPPSIRRKSTLEGKEHGSSQAVLTYSQNAHDETVLVRCAQ